MARIIVDNIVKIEKDLKLHDVKDASYSLGVVAGGNKVFQLDTYSTPIDNNHPTQSVQVTIEDLGKILVLLSSEYQSFNIQLLDDNGSVKYGLNWGNRIGRNPNQAYLDLPPEIYKSEFFPINGVQFTVKTDDGQEIVFTRAQKDNVNGHALQTPLDNSILGTYLRNRLSLKNGELITEESIERYGRNYITISKIGETYYLDFSSSSKKDRLKFPFSRCF